MTGPSSTPRPEHAPRPGVTWNTALVRVETVVDDTTSGPQPNRATRRAAKRATRRGQQTVLTPGGPARPRTRSTEEEVNDQTTTGYCPACGRGDAAPTADDWEQQRKRADQLAGLAREILYTSHNISSQDWARWREQLDNLTEQ